MKKLLIFLAFVSLFASSYDFARNILGDEYYKYENLIKTSLEENASLKKTITFLKNNGLIDLYFNKLTTIHPTFVFLNNNPIFNTKTLNDTLFELGYYSFYPINIHKNKNYSLKLEIISQNHIDPLELLNSLEKRGCKLIDIKKQKDFIYYISCKNEKILKTALLKEDIQALHNINGIYWINPNNFKKILISTSKYDFWHPYVVFYDKNLNILNIISTSNLERKKILNIPQNTAYIKISDTFTKENIKRGIFIKGLK